MFASVSLPKYSLGSLCATLLMVYGMQKLREWLLAALLSRSRSLVVAIICLTFNTFRYF